MSVNEGDVLAGKYRVDKVLGVGGMGVVVAGHHIQLDDKVAIKFMLPEALGNHEAVARFAREARAAVRIKSEHVARVTDVGTLETGAPYMVMEYLDGLDLSEWLRQRGPLPIEQAVEFLLQACEAVAEAHALGIVHRDLKPANLFVIRRADGVLSVKVLDFGISKVTGPGVIGADMTSTNAAMGSPLYMSPEQLQSAKDADARSDIWSIGIILYELLTGESPFNSDTLPSVLLKIMTTAPAPVRAMRPEVPAALEAAILKCLEKDRAKRFPTVGALAVALVEFGPKRSRGSLERISGVMEGAGMSTSGLALPAALDATVAPPLVAGTAASWAQTAGMSKGGKKVLLGSAAAVLALSLAGASAWWAIRGASVPDPELSKVAAGSPARGASDPAQPSGTALAISPPVEPVPQIAAVPVLPAPSAAPSAAAKPPQTSTRRPGPAVRSPPRTPPAVPRSAAAPVPAPVSAPAPAPAQPSTAPKKRNDRALIEDR